MVIQPKLIGDATFSHYPLTYADYVQDGLIIQYDGIQNTRNGHNSSATAWENVGGSSDYDLGIGAGTPIFNTDNVEFNGASALADLSEEQSLPFLGYTFEIVKYIPSTFTYSSIISVFTSKRGSTNTTRRIGNVIRTNRTEEMFTHAYAGSSQLFAPSLTFDEIYHIACIYAETSSKFASSDVFKNHEELEASVKNSYMEASAICCGARKTSNGYDRFFKGKIYAIRIYDRQLSEQELFRNYYIDKIRFNF